jgi:uncharacterized protein YkwD
MRRSLRLLVFVAALTCLLVACGGGGGSAPTSATPIQKLPQGGWPESTYAAPSQELIAYNTFNQARVSCGFGYLQQNAQLDTAALNHVVWQFKNNLYQHGENPGTLAYTGTTSWERMLAAGYVQGTGAVQANEVLTYNRPILSGYGLSAAISLLSAPYHLVGLMNSNREIGISIKTGGPVGSGADIESPSSLPGILLVADMAANTSHPAQLQEPDEVLTYPCAATVGTATALFTEVPSPIPSRNLATQPVGQPIFVQVLKGQVLTLTASSIVKTSDAAVVPLAVTLTSANDPNAKVLPHQAILIPDQPLTANTSYSVTLQGTNNGQAFLKNFTFTTGT